MKFLITICLQEGINGIENQESDWGQRRLSEEQGFQKILFSVWFLLGSAPPERDRFCVLIHSEGVYD